MNYDVRRLYSYHFLSSIALTMVANFVFLDQLMLRMDLNMQQFGFIKGFAWFIPMVINWLISPWVLKLNRDRQIVAVGYLLRVSIPFLLLLLPGLSSDKDIQTIGFSIVLLTALIFPTIANNSIQALMRTYLPRDKMGRSMGWITILWTLPAYLMAVPCSMILNRYSSADDTLFYHAFLVLMLVTTAFQIPADWFILRIGREQRRNEQPERISPGFRAILSPLKDSSYRPLLAFCFCFGIVISMITSFINPYLIKVQGMSLPQISGIALAVVVMGIFFTPFWGRVADQIGGRNILSFAVLGLAVGVFMLLGNGRGSVIIFSVFAWNGTQGIFGSATQSARMYMGVSMSPKETSNIYLASVTASQGLGMLAGSLAGGSLITWLEPRIRPEFAGAHFGVYYLLTAVIALFLGTLSGFLREERRRLGPVQSALEAYRVIKSGLFK